MDSYIELLYPWVSSQLWQFQSSFSPQLNRQKFWFIICPDRIIINPTFTAFHSNFMGCRDCGSFGHKFSPQILLFFTTVVSLQTFCLFLPSPPPFVSCTPSFFVFSSRPQGWSLFQFFSVEMFREMKCGCFPCMCVCYASLLRTKMSKSASELFSTT